MSFDFINRRVNPVVERVLRSPAHRLLSRRLALITVTGRRSGRAYTLPVIYTATPEGVMVAVGASESKTWWRNLRSPAPVELLIRGTVRRGCAQALESAGHVTVAVTVPPLERG